MRATNRTRHRVLVERGEVAATMLARMRGLLGRSSLAPGEGLVLKGENAIHTIGMSFNMDALFLDREGRVVHLIHSMPPWRASPLVWRARDVLELPAGTIQASGTMLGDQIEFQFH